ncbi:MAG TPA: hypothetical protein VFJ60_13705 [Gaiella sp.]|nr:hypothetical protein [Gaiella sp.]
MRHSSEDVLEPHEVHEVEELGRGVPKQHAAPVTPRRDLQAREGVDGHGVRLDVADVAHRDLGGARLEERADPGGEARQVAPRDRAVHGELERARRFQGHRRLDGRRRRNSSALRR